MNPIENQSESGNEGLILPIICPYCKKEIDLGMSFTLLPPDNINITETYESKEEDKETPSTGDA